MQSHLTNVHINSVIIEQCVSMTLENLLPQNEDHIFGLQIIYSSPISACIL